MILNLVVFNNTSNNNKLQVGKQGLLTGLYIPHYYWTIGTIRKILLLWLGFYASKCWVSKWQHSQLRKNKSIENKE